MAVGDIHFLSDQQYMNFKITSEKDAKDSNDAVLVSDITTLNNTISTIGQNNSVLNQNLVSLESHLDTTITEIDVILQDPITTEEYKADTNNYLTFFPNIPANLSKTVYYLNLHNLLLSLNTKLDKTIKFLQDSSGDISNNENFIKLNELLTITFPVFKNNVTNLITVSNSGSDTNERSFKDLVTSIKSLQANTSVQIYTDTQTALDAKSDNEQTNLTVTRYYDKDQNKYYKLFIDSGLIKFEETMHPLFKTYSALMTTLQNGMFNISVEKTDEEILSRFTTYKSLFFASIDDKIYSVINNYVYVYDKETKELLAKIKYQPTELYADMFTNSDVEAYASTNSYKAATYKFYDPNNYYTDNKTENDFLNDTGIHHSKSKIQDFVTINSQELNQYHSKIFMHHYKHYYMKKCNNTLIFGEAILDKILAINLTMLDEKINASKLLNKVYVGEDAWYDQDFINKIKFTNVVLFNNKTLNDTYITSLYWNNIDKILYVALCNNYVYEIGIINEKESVNFDGDIIINYNFSLISGSKYRFGSTLSEQNSYKLSNINFDKETEKLYGIIEQSNIITFNKSLIYLKIDRPNITYVAKTLNFKESPAIRINSLELIYNQALDNYDITIHSLCSGYKNYQYIRNNPHENLNFINKKVLDEYVVRKGQEIVNHNYNSSPYNLSNDSIVLYESSRYIIYLFNGLQVSYENSHVSNYMPYSKKHSIRMFDKKFGIWSYDKALTFEDIGITSYEYNKYTISTDVYIEDTGNMKSFTDLDEKGLISGGCYIHNNLNYIDVLSIKETKNAFELKLTFESLIRPIRKAPINVFGSSSSDYFVIDLSDDLGNAPVLKIIKLLDFYIYPDLDQYRNLLDVKIILTKDE